MQSSHMREAWIEAAYAELRSWCLIRCIEAMDMILYHCRKIAASKKMILIYTGRRNAGYSFLEWKMDPYSS